MQVKLLHDLVEELAGINTGRIVEILFGKKDVNEFLIAKKMELTINQVRNILYKLSADGLVSFIRKKDKRKGWYIYYWTLKTEKCIVKLEQSLLGKIKELEGSLNNRETKRFYFCKSCNIEVSEEKALENGFTCEECADVYELSDNSNQIKETKKRERADKKAGKIEKERKAEIRAIKALARKKISEEKKKTQKKITKNKKISKKVIKKKVKKKAKKIPKKKKR